MKERYRLVSIKGEVSLVAIRRCIAVGLAYKHYWQAPVKSFLIRCTIDRYGKHYRIVAVGSNDPMGYVWRPVAHFNTVFVRRTKCPMPSFLMDRKKQQSL